MTDSNTVLRINQDSQSVSSTTYNDIATISTTFTTTFIWYDNSATQRESNTVTIKVVKESNGRVSLATKDTIQFTSGVVGNGVTNIVSTSTIPESYRPLSNSHAIVGGRHNGTISSIPVNIYTSGVLNFNSAISGIAFPARTLADEPTIFPFSIIFGGSPLDEY